MKPPLYSVEMKILYQEPNRTIYCGHALDILKQMPAESVDMGMTSPPYWGLRSYKTEPQIWDSKDGCRHEWSEMSHIANKSGGYSEKQHSNSGAWNPQGIEARYGFCSLCGAWRGELGLEPTIELYIKHLIQIFNEVQRVLKPSGSCWVNIDDSYNSSTIFNKYAIIKKDLRSEELSYVKLELWRYLYQLWREDREEAGEGNVQEVLPQRLFGEASGEVFRLWEDLLPSEQETDTKPAGTEAASIKGRSANEIGWQVCLLWGIAKGILNLRPYQGRWQEGILKGYGASADIQTGQEGGISYGQISSSLLELQRCFGDLGLLSSLQLKKSCIPKTIAKYFQSEGLVPPKSLCLIPSRFALAMVESGWICRQDIVWNKPNPMPESAKDRFTGSWEHLFFFTKSKRYFFEQQFEPMAYPDRVFNPDTSGHATSQLRDEGNRTTGGLHDGRTQYGNPELGRNKRDVWEIGTVPSPKYKGIRNFATFPEKLCETPILAGCPSMICKKCGKARERIYEATGHINKREPAHVPNNCPTKVDSTGWDYTYRPTGEYTDCGCNAGFEPGVVLDQFCGSGTTLAVAKRLGRKGIGIDISEDYCKLAVKRIQGISLPMEFN